MSGYGDVHIFSIADLPEEDQRRYLAMGFEIKPVERQMIKKEELARDGSINAIRSKVKRVTTIDELTVTEYRRLKILGWTDTDIMRRYNTHIALFYQWKKDMGLKGTTLNQAVYKPKAKAR